MMKKKVEIIPIARRKAERRGVKEAWITETMYAPSQIVPGHGGRNVAQKKYKIRGRKYLLRVVYEESENSYDVVTAYLTTQIERYWKEDENET